MSTAKKQYEEIITFLEENKDKKVSTILPTLIEMCAKKQEKTFKVDEEGNVTHIFCYYHKDWEDITEVEYGKKANTATGYNTMCKEGVSQWTKQQREAKKKKEELLAMVASGEIDPSELPTKLEEIEAERTKIIPRQQ